MTLFEKYGGFGTISKIVLSFYQDLGAHPELKKYFEGIEMPRLIEHQTKFISQALGGPAEYTGRSLEMSHHGLNISNHDFDEVAEILKENLEDAGMEEDDIEGVMNLVGSLRNSIVGK